MFDWITVILILLIVGIILDGIRRVRLAQRSNIKLSRNVNKADAELGEDPAHANSEFPSGGARVVGYREENEARKHTENVKSNFESTRVTLGSSSRIPEQVSLNLEESVPMLMESIEVKAKDEAEKRASEAHEKERGAEQKHVGVDRNVNDGQVESSDDILGLTAEQGLEPTLGSLDGLDAVDEYFSEQTESKLPPVGTGEEIAEGNDKVSDEHGAGIDKDKPYTQEKTKKESLSERIHKKLDSLTSEKLSSEKKVLLGKDDTGFHSSDSQKNESQNATEKTDDYIEPDVVLVVNIMAPPGELFAGETLLKALMDEGMKLGNMDIFHRHYENNGDAAIVFSLANMVMPGTFNLAKMKEFSTPGVSLFLGLPVVGDSLSAYNDLIGTAQRLATTIGGELKDENRSVMTKQTIEHGKQRVIEYERKKKLARV